MVLKEFTWLQREVTLIMEDVRTAIKVEVLKYPGAVAHRLQAKERDSLAKKPKRE